ncbi:unnamed protein product [Durusdinium trenchii]|uniref:PPPDE domain-containing protein n=1 Tax=Durusdinium trenchii TaxID=1381693 RepID=A0ABP0PC77_9DINO
MAGLCCCHESYESESSDDEEGIAEVTLHIYDVSRSEKIEMANDILHKLGTGIFHAAVEVYGLEWSYGKSKGSGVFSCQPRSCKAHHFRESVPMGHTRRTEEEVHEIIDAMKLDWRGPDYDLLKRNCTHFSDDFCYQLGLRRVPKWVMNLSAAGVTVKGGTLYLKSVTSAPGVAAAAKAGSIEQGVIALMEKGRERREAKQGEDSESPFHATDLARGLVQLGQDVRHVDHNGRVHVRDVVAGMKAVVFRRHSSNLDAFRLPVQ